MKNSTSKISISRPCAIGTGLVALDIVVNVHSQEVPQCYAGGTCGNVLIILSYLDWDSAPVSRLSPGPITDSLLDDLRYWNVSTKFVLIENGGSTPIIIQKISRRAAGEPYHSFSWRCPGCGAHLPGYKPILAIATEQLKTEICRPQVFFFDRVSRGTLELAKECADLGALIVFEPSGIGDPRLFREAWSVAHVIKYSHERLRDIAEVGLKQSANIETLLEIETHGADGLRYRSWLPKASTRGWRHLNALKPPIFKDAAGAGDWFTAGLLNQLARGGISGFRRTTLEKLKNALLYGQALAAWNCGFEGARGGMYQVDKTAFDQQVKAIHTGSEFTQTTKSVFDRSVIELLGCLCPSCRKTDFAVSCPAMVNGPKCCR